jgi:DNA-directed RNA polymerase specialized sigma24 family protein
MRDMTLTSLERTAAAAAGDDTATFAMEEEAFRVFYERTARPVWAYLSRMTGDGQLADDLLQETYYRFLRTRREYESDAHRQNALYRIATNLVRDAHRRDRRRFPSATRTITRIPVTARMWPTARGRAPTSRGRWRSCGRAIGSCCGWPTRRR